VTPWPPVPLRGLRSTDGGESIKAFIVKANQSASAEELIAHCRRHLASYKVPKKIEFRQELPRSILGKTLHRILRAEEETQLNLQVANGCSRPAPQPSTESAASCKAGQ
jgi:long-chain acyl-CoA synthetase